MFCPNAYSVTHQGGKEIQMPQVKTVERQIRGLEGFDVAITHLDGRDVRGDRTGLPAYPYTRKASDSMTVSRWKTTRFTANYAGFDILVLGKDGEEVHGSTQLHNLRD